jgi:hypothetical protein
LAFGAAALALVAVVLDFGALALALGAAALVFGAVALVFDGDVAVFGALSVDFLATGFFPELFVRFCLVTAVFAVFFF